MSKMEGVRSPDMWLAFRSACQKNGSSPAYRLYPSDFREATYGEVLLRVERLCSRLNQATEYARASTSSNGQAVFSALLPNSWQHLELFYAAAGLRVMLNPLNHRLAAAELQEIVGESSAAVLFAATSLATLVDQLDFSRTNVQLIVWISIEAEDAAAARREEEDLTISSAPSCMSYTSLTWATSSSTDSPSFEPLELALASPGNGLQLFFTSGTTGKPKGVVHTHAMVYNHSMMTIEALRLDVGSESPHCWGHFGPMFHVGDVAFAWITMMIGGRHAFHPQQRHVGEVLAVMRQEEVTITKLVPTMLANIVTGSYVNDTPDGSNFSKLQWILTGGAPLPPELRHEVTLRLGCQVVQGYGMTEATCHISFVWDPSTTGMEVLPGLETRILGEDDRALPDGSIGEVVVRGANIHNGYLGKQKDAESGFLPDGFFRTGDLGHKNEHGLLFISGRKKDVIIVGGENVFASEVERVIDSHPAVLKSGVVGKADPSFGELVVAAVVLADPTAHGAFKPPQLMSYCRKQLATYKCPVQVYVLAELPMTPSLKVIKPKLKAIIATRDAEVMEAKVMASSGAKAPVFMRQVSLRSASSKSLSRTMSINENQHSDNLLAMLPAYTRPNRRLSAAEEAYQFGQQHLDVASAIQNIVQELVGKHLDPSVDLLEAGLDSVLSLQLVGSLEETFKVELPGGLLFEHPSINDIARFLQKTRMLPPVKQPRASGTGVVGLTQMPSAALPQSNIYETIQEVLEDLTGSNIDKDADLLEAGLDSVLALQLVSSLEESFGIDLPGGLLYEYPSVQSIVGFLSLQQPLTLQPTSSFTGVNGQQTVMYVQDDAPHKSAVPLISPILGGDKDGLADDSLDVKKGSDFPMELPSKPISQANPFVLLANFIALFVRPCLLALGFIPFVVACHYIHLATNFYVMFVVMPIVITACVTFMMHLVLLVKWILLGRVRPGRHKLYSWFYLRWLVVHNLFRTFGVWYGPFRETFVVRWFFRMAGAQIGKGVLINTMWITDPDLVSIGDGSTLARDVNIQPSYITNGWLVLRPVSIGHNCALRHGSSVVCGGSVPPMGILEPLVCASDGAAILPTAQTPPEVLANRHSRRGLISTMAALLYVGYGTSAALCCGAAVVVAAFMSSGAPVPTLATIILGQPEYMEATFYFLLALPPAIYIVMPWAYFAFAALTKLVIIGEFNEIGTIFDQPAGCMVRRFLLARIQDNILFHICLRQSTMSHVTNFQYKAMGAHIGRRAVMCMPYLIEYDLLHAEDDTMLMGETAVLGYNGACQERVTVRKRGALANSVVLQVGSEVGENALLGDFTAGMPKQILSGNLIWSGKPKAYAVSRNASTWEEPQKYALSQVFLAILQLTLGPLTIYPGYIAIRYIQVGITHLLINSGVSSDATRQIILLVALPLYILVIFICKALMVLLVKWVLAGSYSRINERHSKTSYHWVVWIALEALILDIEDVVLMDLRGTAFLVWWYRALGARIGKNCTIFAAPLGAEFDLKSIGDNVSLNFNCRLFGHSIEGHALNFGPCHVDSDVTVGVRSILELGAIVVQQTVVPHHAAVHAQHAAKKKADGRAKKASASPATAASMTFQPQVVKTNLHSIAPDALPAVSETQVASEMSTTVLAPKESKSLLSPDHVAISVNPQQRAVKDPADSRDSGPMMKIPLHTLQAEFFSIDDLEACAKDRLAKRYWDYYSGGAEGEETLRENMAAFNRISIMPRMLVDVSMIDMRRNFLGSTLAFPIIVAPSAMHRLADRESGENATSQAAAKTGAAMVLSTASSTPMEEVAAVQGGNGLLMFQLYCMRDRKISLNLIRRAEASGYKALVVTVDAPRLGRRHRDMHNHMAGHKFPSEVTLPNLELLSHGNCTTTACRLHAMDDQHDDGLTWEGIKWIQSVTSLPVLVKGILRADDALLAVENGCAGIVISNHGGRQLNFAPATITVTKEICDAVAGRVPVLVDGGIRRGTDIFKALALGATAVLVARPVLFGLVVGGQDGVVHALSILKTELELTMALSGCPTINDITADMIRTESPF